MLELQVALLTWSCYHRVDLTSIVLEDNQIFEELRRTVKKRVLIGFNFTFIFGRDLKFGQDFNSFF